MKRSPLKADPEKVRAWREKQRASLKRGKRKRRDPISDYGRAEAIARSKRKCIVCRRRVRLELHHVLPVRLFPTLQTFPANLVAVCAKCHANHENAHRRIRWDELPQCSITLAQSTSGAAALYLERTYPRA